MSDAPPQATPETNDSDAISQGADPDDTATGALFGDVPGPDGAPTSEPAEATASDAGQSDNGAAYLVLARKYRPQRFADVIGQDALIRTLTNAITAGRVHHAYLLTGPRGVGKTTSARLIARALNCIGPDGNGGPTAEPCGVCENCTAIGADRHVDVIEMDAASHTGIDNMREVLDGVRYRPVSARNKVYIIDEVHMLSRSAFNALLKTLEEPPDNVVFIFATTEFRKVPATVVSRCMRFDLRRVAQDELVAYLAQVCAKEGREVADEALHLIARAGEGSVRDSLSLLDQALALGGADAALTSDQVRTMLGLADRSQVLDLLDLVAKGDAAGALDLFGTMYAAGADATLVLQDLLDTTHGLTRLKLAPTETPPPGQSAEQHRRASELAEQLTLSRLSRAWQMMLKGVADVQTAPDAHAAMDMLLVRIAYVHDMPTPGDLAALLAGGAGAAAPVPSSTAPGGAPGQGSPAATAPAATAPAATAPVAAAPAAQIADSAPPADQPPPYDEPPPYEADPHDAPRQAAPRQVLAPQSFADVVALVYDKREGMLHAHLRTSVHLVSFRPGHIELRPGADAPSDLAPRLSQLLTEWTGTRWLVGISDEEGAPTLREQESSLADAREREVREHPLVRAALETFPGAEIRAVRDRVRPDDLATDDSAADGDATDDGDDAPELMSDEG